MPLSLIRSAASAALWFVAASASAQSSWYVSGALGASFRSPFDSTATSIRDPFGNTITQNGAPVPFVYSTQQEFGSGFNIDGAIGRRVATLPVGAVRVEAEIEYRRFVAGRSATQLLSNAFESSPSISGATRSGLVQQRYAATANAFYDLTIFKGFVPYVGVGVGYQYGSAAAGVRTRTVLASTSSQTNLVNVAAGHDDDGTYLAEIGIAFRVARNLSLIPAYRYSDAFAGGRGTHILKVGLRYDF